MTVVLALLFAPLPAMADLSKKAVRKIANQEITKRAPELRGNTGATGPAAIQRFVHVLGDGTVDQSRSAGITQANVFQASPGLYCIVVNTPVKGGQVSVDYQQAVSNETAQFGFSSNAGCANFVATFNNAGNPTSAGFFLTLY